MLDPLGLRHGVLGVAPLVREQGDSVTRLEARGARDGDLCSLLLNEPEDGVRGGIAAVVGFHSAAPNIERTKWGLSAEVFLYIKLRRLAAMLGGGVDALRETAKLRRRRAPPSRSRTSGLCSPYSLLDAVLSDIRFPGSSGAVAGIVVDRL